MKLLYILFYLLNATVLTIKLPGQKKIQISRESTEIESNNLRNLTFKKESSSQNHLARDQFSQVIEPCCCTLNDLKQSLASFSGPDPPFLPAYSGQVAQKIKWAARIQESEACRLTGGTQMCGRPSITFFDKENFQEITRWRHNGLTWNESTNELTLEPQSDDPVGLHKVLLTIYIPGIKDMSYSVEIAYTIESEPGLNQRKLQEQSDQDLPEPKKRQPRRLTNGNCLNSQSNLNLFNTDAFSSQNTFRGPHTQNSFTGCDGHQLPVTNYGVDYQKINLTNGSPGWWSVLFLQQTYIRTTLFTNRDDYIDNLVISTVTVGDNPDVTLNPVCVAKGALTEGGWSICPTQMKGFYFGIYTTTGETQFVQAMAFSQEAIQMKAKSVATIGTNNPLYLASNALKSLVILLPAGSARVGVSSVQITPPAGGLAQFSIQLNAAIPIHAVTMIPCYHNQASSLPVYQANVAISVKTKGGIQQQCGVLADYSSVYIEVGCNNLQGNEIIAEQQTGGYDLVFCGFGALADCDCSTSTFETTVTPELPPSLNIVSTDNIKTFTLITPDTISSVCGNADGFSFCGERVISIEDKLTSQQILTWPYFGYNWIEVTNKLTLDPAQANQKSSLTVTTSLKNKPQVKSSQSMSVFVQGGKTPPIPVIAPMAPIARTLVSEAINAITVSWIKGAANNGTAVIDYRVSWNQGASNYTVLAQGIIATSYIHQVFIVLDTTYKFKIQSRNSAGLSDYSNEVSYIAKPFSIPTQSISAIIGEESKLQLPKVNGNYDFRIKPTFLALVTGAQLTVMSANKVDVGTQTLYMRATDANQISDFVVVVKFKDQITTIPTSKIITSKTQDGLALTSNQTAVLLETVKCSANEAGILTCVDPANGQSYQFNFETGTLVSGQNVQQEVSPKQPTYTVSKVNNRGQFTIKFSDPMNFQGLTNTTTSKRRLKAKKYNGQTESTINLSDDRYLYLLSDKHLNIAVKSDNTTLPKFFWYASNITSTTIVIQVVFQDPLYISNEGVSDLLMIKFLEPALIYFQSLASGALPKNPLRKQIRILPPQVILGEVIERVEAATDSIKNLGQSSVIANIGVQILLSGSMASMWSFVNAQQIIISFQVLNLQMPGNVVMVMTNLANIADFNVFPTDAIMAYLFNFTPTDSPGVGFSAMGNDNRSLILYLGSAFLILILIGLQYILYGLAYGCRHYDKLLNWIEKKIRSAMIFRTLYVFIVQTYLDMAVGSALRFEQPKFETASDYFDFGLACVGIAITVGFPFYCYFFLIQNLAQLDKEKFRSRHGSLYEGFQTHDNIKRKQAVLIVTWFLVRRFFTAVNLVTLRTETIWIQLASNIWLNLIDVCIKTRLNTYESKLHSFTEQINGNFVLFSSYYPLFFTDLIQSQTDKYYIGWYYIGTIGILIVVNLFVMIVSGFQNVNKKISQMIRVYRQKKAIEDQNENKKKQEEAMKIVKSNMLNGLVVAVSKPEPNVGQQEQIEQFKAYKRYQRKKARKLAIAAEDVRKAKENLEKAKANEIALHRQVIREELMQITEVSEVSENDSKVQFTSNRDISVDHNVAHLTQQSQEFSFRKELEESNQCSSVDDQRAEADLKLQVEFEEQYAIDMQWLRQVEEQTIIDDAARRVMMEKEFQSMTIELPGTKECAFDQFIKEYWSQK